MRYVIISPRSYNEKESVMCVFDSTKQFQNMKVVLRKKAESFYNDKVKMDIVSKEDADIFMDDYLPIWDYRYITKDFNDKRIYVITKQNESYTTIKTFSTFKELLSYLKRNKNSIINIYTMYLSGAWESMDIKAINKRLSQLKQYYDRGSTDNNPQDLWIKCAVTLNKCWTIYNTCPPEDADRLQNVFKLMQVKKG